MSDLTSGDREAMEQAFTERFANRRERFGAKPWYVAGWLAAHDYYQSSELEVVHAGELRAGDQVVLRVDQVLAGNRARSEVRLMGIESGPFLSEQKIWRIRRSALDALDQTNREAS